MEFSPEIPINEQQAQAIARGLYAVAGVDGIHEREAALIANFCGATRDVDHCPATSLVELSHLDALSPTDLAASLPGEELRHLFVKAAFLLAYLDGRVTIAERKQIGAYAAALGVARERQAILEQSVRDHLMLSLARLNNNEAVFNVAKKPSGTR
jgi:uncharacterized membrane protein YebE (DUF533 family)